MRTFVTTGLLALLVAAPAALAQTTISTGTINTKVFANGALHGDCNASPTPWFTFNGVEGGCGAGFMLGLSASNVLGDGYILTAAAGWTPGTSGTSTAFPFPSLTNGVRTTFSNAANNLSVEANHYWGSANPDFIVHRYAVTNTGSTPLTNVHAGMYFDYDIGSSSATNLAGYDAASRLAWTRDGVTPTNPYFGVAALSGTVSGWRFDMPYPTGTGVPHTAADRWASMTVTGPVASTARDQRGGLGTGPYTIPAGGTIVVIFASVAGTNQADITANAVAAQGAVVTASEGGPDDRAFRFRSIAPNPAVGVTDIAYTLDETAHVRLAVYDVLGRVVATLADGVRSAGDHTAVFDASALPNGTYVVRLEAAGGQVARPVAVVH